MSSSIADPAAVHRWESLLIDSNLLLLLFVGLHDRSRIEKYKRTAQFTVEDFRLLLAFVGRFREIVTTPSILTEVSNLLGQLPDKLRYSHLGHFAGEIRILHERYTPSQELSNDKAFPRFGLTDTAIIQAARENYLVLTDDFRLTQYLAAKNVDVINFNHLRTFT
jgi:rRNA-processing protein FCF1